MIKLVMSQRTLSLVVAILALMFVTKTTAQAQVRNLEDVLNQAKVDGSLVHITIVSNQDNGLASYAVGDLIFHPATGGEVLDRAGAPRRNPRPAHMESATPLRMFFSDRRLDIDPPSPPLGHDPRQPFSANATEALGVSVAPGFGDHQTIRVSITVFGNSSTFNMERRGNLYVGVGPPLGPSPEAVYVLAFTGIAIPP
jgi:hypothetical protein